METPELDEPNFCHCRAAVLPFVEPMIHRSELHRAATKVAQGPMGIPRTTALTLGAWLAGLLLPSVLAALIALFGLFPIGSFLPDVGILSLLGLLLTVLFLAVLTLAFGIVAAGALGSWLPLGMGFIAVVGFILGTLPGVGVYGAIEEMALRSAASRSSQLVQAILVYEQTYDRPPESLEILVPKLLAKVPSTGMAAHPKFSYAANAGPCSNGNSWHLSIPLVGFDVDSLIYCPQQDYDALERDSSTEISHVGEWARSSFFSD